jgi:4-amino-4-deoxy-L-arabinose transferase-like glycosyltransferase
MMATSHLRKYNLALMLPVNIVIFIFSLHIAQQLPLGMAWFLFYVTSLYLSVPWMLFMLFSASAHFTQCVDINRGSKVPQDH